MCVKGRQLFLQSWPETADPSTRGSPWISQSVRSGPNSYRPARADPWRALGAPARPGTAELSLHSRMHSPTRSVYARVWMGSQLVGVFRSMDLADPSHSRAV